MIDAPSPFQTLAARANLSPAQRRALHGWLGEKLKDDHHARLDQGGHGDARVALPNVFVDLPVGRNAITEPSSSERTFIDTLFSQQDRRHDERAGPHGHRAVVLIGGPGQGKSTVVQLACQSQRVALLRGEDLPAELAGICAARRWSSAVATRLGAKADEPRSLWPL